MLLRDDAFSRLCRARDWLREIREPSPTVEQIARAVGVSPFHFIRQFEAAFGETPHQFRIRARLEMARTLLAAGQHSVTDVCMEVGFSSLGSFSRLFARRVGESPSLYQRRVRPLVRVPGHLPPELVPGCLALMARLPADAFVRLRQPAG
jgi:AraC-like DNA-binding protein